MLENKDVNGRKNGRSGFTEISCDCKMICETICFMTNINFKIDN